MPARCAAFACGLANATALAAGLSRANFIAGSWNCAWRRTRCPL